MRCNICNSQNAKLALIKLKSPLGGLWDIYECRTCTTQFIHPMPSPEELNHFYDQLYRGGSAERTKALTNPAANQRYWQRQWEFIKGLIRNEMNGKVLDMGCGGGTLWIMRDLAGKNMELNFQRRPERLPRGKGLTPLKHLRELVFLKSSSMS